MPASAHYEAAGTSLDTGACDKAWSRQVHGSSSPIIESAGELLQEDRFQTGRSAPGRLNRLGRCWPDAHEVTDDEMRAESNRTFRRIVAGLSPAVGERYRFAEPGIDPLRERLDAAVASRNWSLASQIAAELENRDVRAS